MQICWGPHIPQEPSP